MHYQETFRLGCSLLLAGCLLDPASLFSQDASPTVSTDGTEFVIGPKFSPAPEFTVRNDVTKGTIQRFTMKSAESQIYSGIAKNKPGVVPYERKVAVYLPAGYQAATPLPLMVLQDGIAYLGLTPVFDNLIHERRIPPMAVVFINSGGGDSKGSQRGLEYDAVNGVYAEFIETEVLPRIERDYGVKFTDDPDGRAAMGGSSGAAAAFTMAWFRPDLYRRVLSYSGTFVDQQHPEDPALPDGAWEYHKNLIPTNDRKPIRVWLEISEFDNGHDLDEASLHNWVMANERMAAALKAKGYEYRYVFAKGARHVDRRVTRQTFPAALQWLWEGYSPAQ